jgi:hypothetical protein
MRSRVTFCTVFASVPVDFKRTETEPNRNFNGLISDLSIRFGLVPKVKPNRSVQFGTGTLRGVLIIFDEVCFSMRNYFEDAEYRRSILFKWNNLTLKSIMIKSENEDKSVEECLQLLIKQLRHLQHDLNSELRSEKFIHNKLINACQDVFVCQYVCFKFSDSLIDLINDLKSSIITY